MITSENERLIRECLDISINAPEHLKHFAELLSEDCTWMPATAF